MSQKDVKHYEDCEQLFLTVGLCLTIEALTEFFQMTAKEAHPATNIPPFHNIHVGDNRKQYFDGILSQFVSTFLLPQESICTGTEQDWIMNYSLSLLQYYFLLIDFKDAVKEGNGKHLSICTSNYFGTLSLFLGTMYMPLRCLSVSSSLKYSCQRQNQIR